MSIQAQNELNELRGRIEALERLVAELQSKKGGEKTTLHLKGAPRG